MQRLLTLATCILVTTAACTPNVPPGPTVAGPQAPTVRRARSIVYVPRSSQRVEQLIGETDKERHRETLNRTASRFKLFGTDLGYSFEHQGKAVFLFGDAVGLGAGDP